MRRVDLSRFLNAAENSAEVAFRCSAMYNIAYRFLKIRVMRDAYERT
jgi:hypothetical protein